MSDTQSIVPVPAGERVQAAEQALETIKQKNGNQGEGGGQPTKLDDARVNLLITAFQNGLDVKSACIYAGISRTIYYRKYNEDPKFVDIVERAKNNLKEMAGNRIMKILKDGEDKVAAPLAWKIFERQMPADYGQRVVQNDNSKTQNNNFYVLAKNEISNIAQQPDIAKASPAELFEALEETPNVDADREEGSFAQIHHEEIRSDDSDSSDMSQSPSTL